MTYSATLHAYYVPGKEVDGRYDIDIGGTERSVHVVDNTAI